MQTTRTNSITAPVPPSGQGGRAGAPGPGAGLSPSNIVRHEPIPTALSCVDGSARLPAKATAATLTVIRPATPDTRGTGGNRQRSIWEERRNAPFRTELSLGPGSGG